jgi:hypothetical protein
MIHNHTSHENKKLFCFLLQPSYEIQITEITSISDNKEYVDPVEVSAGTSTFSIKATVKKEIPLDAMVRKPVTHTFTVRNENF